MVSGFHPDSEIRWGAGLKRKIFRPFGPQFSGPKIRGGGGAWAPPLDLPLPPKFEFKLSHH